MKTRYFITLFAILMIAVVISCEKTSTNNTITPEEAKVEIRAAAQQLTNEMDAMMNTPAMVTLTYLSELNDNASLKSTLKSLLKDPSRINYHNLTHLRSIGDNPQSAQVNYMSNPGIYRFSFLLNDFELIEPSTSMIKLTFPANEQSYNNQLLDAELIATNLELTIINYTDRPGTGLKSAGMISENYSDTVITKADVTMSIDLVQVMTATYQSELSSTGAPTSVVLAVTMAPYALTLDFHGSGVNYTLVTSLKLNNAEILGVNTNLVYTSDMSEVEQLSGSYLMPPLKFEGWINVKQLQDYTATIDSTQNYDIGFMNSLMNMTIYDTDLDAQLGSLIFQLYVDPDTGEKAPMLAVLYSDGSWEWLNAIISSGGSKSAIARKK